MNRTWSALYLSLYSSRAMSLEVADLQFGDGDDDLELYGDDADAITLERLLLSNTSSSSFWPRTQIDTDAEPQRLSHFVAAHTYGDSDGAYDTDADADAASESDLLRLMESDAAAVINAAISDDDATPTMPIMIPTMMPTMPMQPAAVTDNSGRVVGVSSAADIERSLMRNGDVAAAAVVPASAAPVSSAPTTVAVPLPPDASAPSAPSVYIPLPAKHFAYMSKSEVALIIKLQLAVLQNNDTTADDYYAAVYESRKGRRLKPHLSHLPPILPNTHINAQRAGASDATLGKLQKSSLRKPKTVMNINGADANKQTPYGGLFSARSIDYLIEEAYRALMEVEDIDSIIAQIGAIPPPSSAPLEDPAKTYERARWINQRSLAVESLMEAIDVANADTTADDVPLLHHFYRLAKGRTLIFRCLVILAPPLTHLILAALIHDLVALTRINEQNAQDDKLFAVICDTAYSAHFTTIIHITAQFAIISRADVQRGVSVITSKLGCTLLQVTLKRAHEHNGNGHDDEAANQSAQWRHIFDDIVAAISHSFKQIVDGDNAVSAASASTAMRWEVVAAIISHCRREQRDAIARDIAPAFIALVKETYLTNKNKPPPPLSSAWKYLLQIFTPADQQLINQVNAAIANAQASVSRTSPHSHAPIVRTNNKRESRAPTQAAPQATSRPQTNNWARIAGGAPATNAATTSAPAPAPVRL